MDKDKNPNFRHGMFEDTGNFSHTEKLRVFESAEDYIEQLGGEDAINQHEVWDCYYLSLTEFRLARAEGLMFDDVEEYLHKSSPEQNMSMLFKRARRLREDLGLLETEQEKAMGKASGFFDAMSESED